MKRIAPLALVALVMLTGCTPTPNRADVLERAQIELEGTIFADTPALAEGIADDAFKGLCGSDAYRAELDEFDDLQYAWDVTCSHYFSHEMTEAQQERVRLAVLDRALEGVSDD